MFLFYLFLYLMGRWEIRSPNAILVILAVSVLYIPMLLWPIWVPVVTGVIALITIADRRYNAFGAPKPAEGEG